MVIFMLIKFSELTADVFDITHLSATRKNCFVTRMFTRTECRGLTKSWVVRSKAVLMLGY